MYEVEKECIEHYRMTSREGDFKFSLGTDLPTRTQKFGRLRLDLEKGAIFFCPYREGMDEREVLFYLNGDDYVPKGDTELTQLYKRLQETLRKPWWKITPQGFFDYAYRPRNCKHK